MVKQAKPTPGKPVLLDSTVLVRTACMPLKVSPDQHELLQVLQHEFNLACNRVANRAVQHRTWNRVKLHHLSYVDVRSVSPLKSQFVINAIGKVCAAYKALQGNGGFPAKGKGPCPLIRFDRGAVHFDARTFSLRTFQCPVSRKTTGVVELTIMAGQVPTDKLVRQRLGIERGRMSLEVAIGSRQAAMLATGRWREADLVYKANAKAGPRWELHLALEYDKPELAHPQGGWLGVDVGDNYLVSTSSGLLVGGGGVRHTRSCFLSHRDRLQTNGSQSALQTLRQVSGKESRFVMNVCRDVALKVVGEALKQGARGLVLEDLTGIHQKHTRKAKKARKDMRRRLRNWPYAKLKASIIECAQAHGLDVLMAHPAYTSQTCSQCGQLGKRHQHRFTCQCGHRTHSDTNASWNLKAVGESWALSQGASQRAPEHVLEISARPNHREHGYDKLRPSGRGS